MKPKRELEPEMFWREIGEAARSAGATDEQADRLTNLAGAAVDACLGRLAWWDSQYRLKNTREFNRAARRNKKTHVVMSDLLKGSGNEGVFRQLGSHAQKIIDILDSLPPGATELLLLMPQSLRGGLSSQAAQDHLRAMLKMLTVWSSNEAACNVGFMDMGMAGHIWRREMLRALAAAWRDVLGVEPEPRGPFYKAASVTLEASGVKLSRNAIISRITAAI